MIESLVNIVKARLSVCRRSRSGQRGASLVEILVAVLIFALGSLAVLTMTMGSFQTNSHSAAIDCGTNLGRATMDWLLSLPYDDPLLQDRTADASTGLLDASAAAADFSHEHADYPFNDAIAFPPADNRCFNFERRQVYWNIAHDFAGNNPVSGVKTLSVLVVWAGSKGRKQAVFQTVRVNES